MRATSVPRRWASRHLLTKGGLGSGHSNSQHHRRFRSEGSIVPYAGPPPSPVSGWNPPSTLHTAAEKYPRKPLPAALVKSRCTRQTVIILVIEAGYIGVSASRSYNMAESSSRQKVHTGCGYLPAQIPPSGGGRVVPVVVAAVLDWGCRQSRLRRSRRTF